MAPVLRERVGVDAHPLDRRVPGVPPSPRKRSVELLRRPAPLVHPVVDREGLIFATHTALAWNMLRRDEQFRSALASRDVIGQAKGMLMERFGIDAVRAFDLLKRLSQDSNTPLHEVAERLTSSGRHSADQPSTVATTAGGPAVDDWRTGGRTIAGLRLAGRMTGIPRPILLSRWFAYRLRRRHGWAAAPPSP